MSGNNIKVVCRFRPFNRMETESNSEECIDIEGDTTVRMKNSVAVAGPEKDGFNFDRVFPSQTTQSEIFDWGVKGIVEDVMAGFNGTLFCYGQTGSGKTFTMMGADISDPSLRGLIPRITEQIFASIITADHNIEYTVKVSYMEIYMERIKDLLNPENSNLSIHEDKARGVYVKDLTEIYVGSEAEVYGVMKAGGSARAVASTQMNAESSRSHSIFVMGIHQRNVETGSQKSGNLYLVDLAGSEKIGKTGATGQTLEEAKKINKSLSALGMVINNLTDGKSTHIPYRDSKLTRILQESLGGNSRTTLIINCSPASFNEAETLGTLRFGMRAKSIKNKARVNAELSPAELKKQLAMTKGQVRLFQFFSEALEGEVTVWRGGRRVEEPDWATLEKARAAVKVMEEGGGVPSTPAPAAKRPPSAMALGSPGPGTPARSATPALGSEGGQGRETPMLMMGQDERDEFLRRENELNDQIAEKEQALAEQEKAMVDMRDEMAYFREQNEQMMKDHSTVNLEVTELRMSQTRLESEIKEASTALEQEKDRTGELEKSLSSHRVQLEEMKQAQAASAADDREKRKAEMLADMMAKIDTGGAFLDSGSEKLRILLAKLDNIPNDPSAVELELVMDTRDTIRRHLADNQTILRDLQERLRRSQEEADLQGQRSDELQELLAQRDGVYEDLLAQQSSDVVGVQEIRSQLEAQYATKQSVLDVEMTTLRRQLDAKETEMEELHSIIDDQASTIEDMNRMLASAASGVAGGPEFAQAAQELDRTRKAMDVQNAEFEVMKRNLMRDVTDRCEKVVELQIQLDEVREKYKAIARSTNAKAHNKKMQTLEYNLGQLNEVQRGLVYQNTSLKKDVNTAERKLAERKERIINLERLVAQSESQLKLKEQEFQRITRELREQLTMAQARENAMPGGGGLGFGRIAKPLRGGGGSMPHTGTPSYAALSAIPGRLAGEDSVGAKRQSWFFSKG